MEKYRKFLEESLILKIKNNKSTWQIDENRLTHFSNIFRSVVEDFSKTYKKEPRYELNPNEWYYSNRTSCGGQVSYFDSLFSVYVRLNLILLDSRLNKNSPLTNYIYGHIEYVLEMETLNLDEYIVNKFKNLKEKLFEGNI